MRAARIFKACAAAMDAGKLIEREGRTDKEFHFQNWFKARLDELGERYDSPGRNAYPDFRLTQEAEGYEIKGLAYPGREASYDSNSQAPCGEHNGRRSSMSSGGTRQTRTAMPIPCWTWSSAMAAS